MDKNPGNIYKNARSVAGLTQERWAEAIGCSVDSVHNYEAGTQLPSDDIVRTMCEISGLTPLAYWHVCRKSELAANLLPSVEKIPLPQAVLQLMLTIKHYYEQEYDMLQLAADGEISDDELIEWTGILDNLDAVIKAALQVKYAEGGV